MDLHERSTQPLTYEHRRRSFVLTFNGEIYNYQALRAELAALGHTFRTSGDTEVILAAYAEWGASCVHRFNGMWAFALYDEEAQTLFLSRDRFGKKPLYYSASEGKFAFASEIKALLEAAFVRRVVDSERVSDFLTFGLVGHTDRTFFRDVRQMPAGSNGQLDLRTGRFRVERFYQPVVGEQRVAPDDLREVLSRAVQRRLISDVPICLSLSGGIDSSSIAALIAEGHDDRMVAFTTTSEDGVGDETQNVRELLKIYPQFELVKVPLAPTEPMPLLSELVHHMDEPFIYDSPFVRSQIARAIHQHGFKVSLTGEGADELLGGYDIASPLFLLDLLRRRRPVLFAKELYHSYHLPKFREIARRVAAPFFEHRRRRVSEFLIQNAREHGSRLPPTGPGAPLQEHDVTLKEKLLTQISAFFLPYLLTCNDKMYMAHSVEARAPFLDVEVVELSLRIATEDLIKDGLRKAPLRAAMHGRIPSAILSDKRKIGFASPMRKMFAAPSVQTWVKDAFSDARSESYVDPKALCDRYEGAINAGQVNDFLANAIVLELWMRDFDVTPE